MKKISFPMLDGPVYITPFFHSGMVAYDMLNKAGVKVAAFCDINPDYVGEFYDGRPIVSRNDLLREGVEEDAIFVVASVKHEKVIWEEIRGECSQRIFALEDILSQLTSHQIWDSIREACREYDPAKLSFSSMPSLGNNQVQRILLMRYGASRQGKARFDGKRCEKIELDYRYFKDLDFLLHCFKQQMKDYDYLERLELRWERPPWDGTPKPENDKVLLTFLTRLKECHIPIRQCRIVNIDVLHWMNTGLYGAIMEMLPGVFSDTCLESVPRVIHPDNVSVLSSRLEEYGCGWEDLSGQMIHTVPKGICLFSQFLFLQHQENSPYLYFPHEDQYRCIHIHNAYSASLALSNHLFGDMPIHGPNIRDYRKVNPEKCREYFKFSVVRNPWDRLASIYFRESAFNKNYDIYLQSYSKQTSFHYFASYSTFREAILSLGSQKISQYSKLSDEKGNMIMDYVGRFENLQQSADEIAAQLGMNGKVGHPVLPGLAFDPTRKPYWEYYDEETMEIVAQACKQDIEYFGYEFRPKRVVLHI